MKNSFILFLSIICIILSTTQIFADSSNYLLVADFSFTNPYTPVSDLNPYWEDAQPPLWGNTSDPWDDAYHTNYLGYYTGSGPWDGLASVEWGGFRGFGWNTNQPTWWWYTLLCDPDINSKDITIFDYLIIRVKGENDGERFAIKLDDISGNYGIIYIDNYIEGGEVNKNWKTIKIPLTDFNDIGKTIEHSTNPIYFSQSKAVSLVFYATDVRDLDESGSNDNDEERIYFDDISFRSNLDIVPNPTGFTKPTSESSVKIINKQLQVAGENYFIKGTGYFPVPVGQTPNWGSLDAYTQTNCERDFPLLTQMGVNTIRTWGKINNDLILYGLTPFNIKVCAGFWIPQEISFLNDFAKERIKPEFSSYITTYKDEPSILMWVIGNENNLVNGWDWHWYNFANELAAEAYSIEDDYFHPVSIVEGDKDTIGKSELGSDDAHLNYIDVVGYNSYRGKTFTDLFQTYSSKTNKAIWISEYGIDAWNSFDPENPWNGYEDQSLQNKYDVLIWLDVVRNKDKCIGASVMSYSDDWWGDPYYFINQDPGTPSDPNHLSIHDFGGIILGGRPDNFSNQEWWGIVKYDEVDNTQVIARTVLDNLYSTTIGGRVLDASTGLPISSTTVQIIGPSNRSILTDEDGLYFFSQINEGNYLVKTSLPGHSDQNISITESDSIVIDFPAKPSITSIVPASGKVGDEVTITGNDLGITEIPNGVKFNGITSTDITSWTDSEIVCIVPPSTTTGNVTVTTYGGTSNGMLFTIINDTPCFIATAAYGNTHAEEVEILRAFRDQYLMNNKPGRKFVELYYRFSPPIADYLNDKPLLRETVRAMLKPLVWFSKKITK